MCSCVIRPLQLVQSNSQAAEYPSPIGLAEQPMSPTQAEYPSPTVQSIPGRISIRSRTVCHTVPSYHAYVQSYVVALCGFLLRVYQAHPCINRGVQVYKSLNW